MPLLDAIKDPATGKIKPVVIIAAGGIGVAGVFLLMGRSGSSGGVVSPGQSGENTGSLSDLMSAIQDLATAVGNPNSTTTTTPTAQTPATVTSPTVRGSQTVTNLTKTTAIAGSHSNVPSISSAFSAVKLGSSSPAAVVSNVVAAVAKPVNSGLSSAPTVLRPATIALGSARSYNAARDAKPTVITTVKSKLPATSSLKLTTTKAIAKATAKPAMSGTHVGGGGPQEY